jgi:hypothetical protein
VTGRAGPRIGYLAALTGQTATGQTATGQTVGEVLRPPHRVFGATVADPQDAAFGGQAEQVDSAGHRAAVAAGNLRPPGGAGRPESGGMLPAATAPGSAGRRRDQAGPPGSAAVQFPDGPEAAVMPAGFPSAATATPAPGLADLAAGATPAGGRVSGRVAGSRRQGARRAVGTGQEGGRQAAGAGQEDADRATGADPEAAARAAGPGQESAGRSGRYLGTAVDGQLLWPTAGQQASPGLDGARQPLVPPGQQRPPAPAAKQAASLSIGAIEVTVLPPSPAPRPAARAVTARPSRPQPGRLSRGYGPIFGQGQ